MSRFDVIIAGQGLAGSTLAARLIERGSRVLVVDRDEPVTSSKVAAGLVTPITGRHLTKSWRLDTLLPEAVAFYREVQRWAGRRLWFGKPIVRLFRSEEESALWRRRLGDGDCEPWVSVPRIGPDGAGDDLLAPFGGFEMRGGGWVDVPGFLEAVRHRLENHEEGCAFLRGEVRADDVRVDDDAVRWGEFTCGTLVFCQGHEGAANRFFDWIPFRSAKGEILDVVVDGFGDDRIVNSGGWLLPLPDGRFRAGSTYSWDELDTLPTKRGRKRITGNLHRFLVPRFAIVGQQAAVRPIIRASRLVMGRHPTHDRIAFFNGLGSKGVVTAPHFADRLAAHLVEGLPIEEEVDLRRNF